MSFKARGSGNYASPCSSKQSTASPGVVSTKGVKKVVARPRGLQWGVVANVWGGARSGVQGQSPWSRGQKLKSFQPSKDKGTWQICHPVKYSVNCSNILLEKVFVSPLP